MSDILELSAISGQAKFIWGFIFFMVIVLLFSFARLLYSPSKKTSTEKALTSSVYTQVALEAPEYAWLEVPNADEVVLIDSKNKIIYLAKTFRKAGIEKVDLNNITTVVHNMNRQITYKTWLGVLESYDLTATRHNFIKFLNRSL